MLENKSWILPRLRKLHDLTDATSSLLMSDFNTPKVLKLPLATAQPVHPTDVVS